MRKKYHADGSECYNNILKRNSLKQVRDILLRMGIDVPILSFPLLVPLLKREEIEIPKPNYSISLTEYLMDWNSFVADYKKDFEKKGDFHLEPEHEALADKAEFNELFVLLLDKIVLSFNKMGTNFSENLFKVSGNIQKLSNKVNLEYLVKNVADRMLENDFENALKNLNDPNIWEIGTNGRIDKYGILLKLLRSRLRINN